MVLHTFNEAKRSIRLFGKLAKIAIGVRAKRHILMAKGRNRRYQFDAESFAIVIEFEDVLGPERISAAPCLFQPFEKKTVLDI